MRIQDLKDGNKPDIWCKPVSLSIEVQDKQTKEKTVETVRFIFALIFCKEMINALIAPLDYRRQLPAVSFYIYLTNNHLSVNKVHTYRVSNNVHGVYVFEKDLTLRNRVSADLIPLDIYKEVMYESGLRTIRAHTMKQVLDKVKDKEFVLIPYTKNPAMQMNTDRVSEFVLKRFMPSIINYYEDED